MVWEAFLAGAMPMTLALIAGVVKYPVGTLAELAGGRPRQRVMQGIQLRESLHVGWGIAAQLVDNPVIRLVSGGSLKIEGLGAFHKGMDLVEGL